MSGPAAGEQVLVSAPPSLARLYARSLAGGRRGGGLGERTLVLRQVDVDAERVAAYARTCGYPAAGAVPLPYPHLLAFPLQVQLMVTEAFPFRLLGLVHVRQQVVAHRRLSLTDRPSVQVRAERLVPHPRGATVDLLARVDVGGEAVWEGRSTYLARGARTSGDAAPTEVADIGDAADAAAGATGVAPTGPRDDGAPMPTTALWRVPADTGRRYAAVSGDVNPIHLHPLAARALGFPRAIAHGMWTAARALAALEPRLPQAVRVDVQFRRPVLLPAALAFAAARPAQGGWDVVVRSRAGERVHLLGAVRPLG
ncbi:MaoC/PaaZ C-terminal domain-containing protein [Quadrisphaera sp. DSM 44207]|uniref:MaoC/PaaZ C-terminal domain-containing protein n=1 Tax=Quadrisphaera sp. DSM 44207 TaxID=1881057 RepID=UPI00088A3F74|nr:MaoC/PaaZ C-terminal domain-containing protein [Quadrisphaera sp. DSM 44207]SDQ37611.1 Acyl dehydratase [Quadrisphaera sp. DSM 44207]